MLTVSRVHDVGPLGLRDVALSLPTIVGTGGATDVVVPEMDDAEREGLERSASVLRKALDSLGSPESSRPARAR